MKSNIPMVYHWHGKDIEELSQTELLCALRECIHLYSGILNDSIRHYSIMRELLQAGKTNIHGWVDSKAD